MEKINHESNLTKGLNIITNVFYVINQVIVAALIASSVFIYVMSQKEGICYALFSIATIVCVILLLRFITIGPKILWQIAIIIFTVLYTCFMAWLLVVKEETLEETLEETRKKMLDFAINASKELENIPNLNKILVALSSILLIIILCVMYLYYMKQHEKLKSYSGHYFVVSTAVLILGLFSSFCILLYFKKNDDNKETNS